jgi:hypothetical protein
MLNRFPAMLYDVLAIATGLMQSIRKDRHIIEGFLGVNVFGQRLDSGSKPRWIYGDGTEGQWAEDLMKKTNENTPLGRWFPRKHSCG